MFMEPKIKCWKGLLTYSLFQKVAGSYCGNSKLGKWRFWGAQSRISNSNNFFSMSRMRMTYIWKMLQIWWTFWKSTSWYPENNTYPKYCSLKSHCGFLVSEQYHTWTTNYRKWLIPWRFWAETALNLINIRRSFGTDFGKTLLKKIGNWFFESLIFALKTQYKIVGNVKKATQYMSAGICLSILVW